MADSEKTSEEKIGSISLIDGKQNYKRQPKPSTRSKSCSSSRLWIFFTVLFFLTTVGAVAAFIWRHAYYEEDKSTNSRETNQTQLYLRYRPLFRTPEEQRIFSEKVYIDQERNSIPTDDIFRNRTTCNLTCGPDKDFFLNLGSEAPSRQVGQSNSQGSVSNHGCCQSQAYFQTPNSATTFDGSTKQLVQDLNGRRQYFRTEVCRQVNSCSGCTCTRISQAFTALVINLNVDDEDDDDRYQIAFISLLGCCKCLN